MKILLKNTRIIDAESRHHNTRKDIYIEQGRIEKIGSLSGVFPDIVYENVCVSRGWVDTGVSFGEPGYEERETLSKGLEVAGKSGFTQVMLHPDTDPVIDTQQEVAFVLRQSKTSVVSVHPIGAATRQSQGEDMASLYEMKNAGAVAFGDYKKSFRSANLLKIALQYTQSFNGIVCAFPLDSSLAGKGVVNEHIASTYSGLKGIPAVSEYLCVDRDLKVLEYAGGKLHIPTISCEESLELIRQAKKKGCEVTCSVAVHHLHFSDSEITDFDTNYKVMPPLRDKRHIEALRQGLLDGTIDFVTSDHRPMNIEQKCREFEHAAYGTIGLETAFGILRQYVSVERAVELLTRAKSYFSLPNFSIEEGNWADITVFDPDKEYYFSADRILSSSKNTMFLGEKMKGMPLGVITVKGALFRD